MNKALRFGGLCKSLLSHYRREDCSETHRLFKTNAFVHAPSNDVGVAQKGPVVDFDLERIPI